ncbi:uncharacterized protein LOC124357467 [Homalodisca vitripennis]|uniref:uncharacterized protein LOC124357467 n=1 Tax=Homalodisca vitripennis TaxID=197043 RepID=UPI001EEC73E4|nr:uncharacterized protein LOC124357467 [Homalodisca vitripennis]KAG8302493.1 hypothetical protein J6590_031564 [Homalodisca vitripennis]
MDSENVKLAEWLQMLGCPITLNPVDLQRLNTPNMRSVWRHLQAHVQPRHSVQTVRQNLLLSKLHNQNILPGEFGNFRVQSIQELSQLQNMSDAKKEINYLKNKVRAADEELRATSFNLLTKINEKEMLKLELKENEDKTVLLSLYRSRIRKDIEKVNIEIEKTNCLKINPNPLTSTEMKHDKSVVASYLTKCIVSTSDTIDNDALNDMIVSTLEFPSASIYEGIMQVSKSALRTLKSYKSNMDSSSCFKTKEARLISGTCSFSKHLTNLNFLVFQNELDLSSCRSKVKEYSTKLEKEKLILKNFIEETCVHDCVGVIDDLSAKDIINSLVENSIYLKELEQLKVLNSELDIGCSDYDDLKLLVERSGKEEKTLFENVDKKVKEVNRYVSLILNGKLDIIKTAALKTCTELISNFFIELKFQKEDCEALFVAYKSIIGKECELIQNEPLNAILRKWEEPCILFSDTLMRDLSKNSSLLPLLLQSQPKNVLNTILEKVCWSHTIDYW